MNSIQDRIATAGLLPVIKLNHAEDAVPLAKALIDGGLPIMEITFRTEAAEKSIGMVSDTFPDILTGAGTVTSLEQAKCAFNAGAKFMITPGISTTVIEFCLSNNLPVYPGVCTPSEIMQVMEFGLDVVKFFPAAQYGGLTSIKTLSAVFPSLKFIPTGGITTSNLLEYLAFPRVLACGGSWMVKEDMIDKGDFNGITALVKEAVEMINMVM